jgi:hypothetical protein
MISFLLQLLFSRIANYERGRTQKGVFTNKCKYALIHSEGRNHFKRVVDRPTQLNTEHIFQLIC